MQLEDFFAESRNSGKITNLDLEKFQEALLIRANEGEKSSKETLPKPTRLPRRISILTAKRLKTPNPKAEKKELRVHPGPDAAIAIGLVIVKANVASNILISPPRNSGINMQVASSP